MNCKSFGHQSDYCSRLSKGELGNVEKRLQAGGTSSGKVWRVLGQSEKAKEGVDYQSSQDKGATSSETLLLEQTATGDLEREKQANAQEEEQAHSD